MRYFFFKRKLWRKYELLEWFLSRLFLFTIVFLAIHYGFIGYVMNFLVCTSFGGRHRIRTIF